MKRVKKTLLIITAVLILLIGGCAFYLADYYPADEQGLSSWETAADVHCEALEDGSLVYRGERVHSGLIFYPGGKVDHRAYEPLMKELASRGMMCVVAQMPFRLAVLDVDAAQQLRAGFPEVQHWYIGGHSLGGSMAASHLSDHVRDYEGLILLGAYSTADLSDTNIKVLSVYGSEDQVMDHEKYDANQINLPPQTHEYVIEGGCHAYFGMYGPQSGDGIPRISNESQIYQTADLIVNYMK